MKITDAEHLAALRAKANAGTLSDWDRMALKAHGAAVGREEDAKRHRADAIKFGGAIFVALAIIAVVGVIQVAANDWDWKCLVVKCVRVKP